MLGWLRFQKMLMRAQSRANGVFAPQFVSFVQAYCPNYAPNGYHKLADRKVLTNLKVALY